MRWRYMAVVDGKAASDTRRCIANRDGHPQNVGVHIPDNIIWA